MATDKGLEDVPEGQIESNYDETVDSFDDMKLKPELLRGKYTLLHCDGELSMR
jgi:translation initiation factor 4A